MGHRAASSSSALPRFLLSLSASSTSSQQQLHGPPLSPDSACQSTGQDSIELVAVRHQSWSNSDNLLTAAAAAAATPRVVRHKRASLSLPVVATPSSSSTSVPEEEKIASLERDKHLGLGLGRRSRSSTTTLACSTVSATDSLGKGITPAERQNKANRVWRGYW